MGFIKIFTTMTTKTMNRHVHDLLVPCVHQAKLDVGMHEGRCDGIRKALEAVNADNEDVAHSTVLEFKRRTRGAGPTKNVSLAPLTGQDPVYQRIEFVELLKLEGLPGLGEISTDALDKVWPSEFSIIIFGEFSSKRVVST